MKRKRLAGVDWHIGRSRWFGPALEAPVGSLFFNDQASCLVTVLGWILFVCLFAFCLVTV